MDDQQQTNSQNPQQGSLWEVFAARDEAVDRVERNADSDWKTKAYEAGKRLARDNKFIISEEIWDALSVEGVTTHEPRAMGPIMRRLQADKIIEPTGDFVISPSPLGHGRPSRVWASLIVAGTDRTLETHDSQPATDRRPCPECNTTTCSRRPGWPYCYGTGHLHQRDWYADRERLDGRRS